MFARHCQSVGSTIHALHLSLMNFITHTAIPIHVRSFEVRLYKQKLCLSTARFTKRMMRAYGLAWSSFKLICGRLEFALVIDTSQ